MTVPRCHKARHQVVPPSSCSWKMRQRIRSSAPTVRDAPTRSLRGAALARRTERGDPRGRIGPPPPGLRADAEERVQGGHQKPGAPFADWQGSRQTSGLACQTPAASPRTSRRWAAVGGMNSLTSSCLRRIPRRSQAFFKHQKNKPCPLSSGGRVWGVRESTTKGISMIRLLMWNHVSTTPQFIGKRGHKQPQQSVGRPNGAHQEPSPNRTHS